ncbi:hypothetical protein EI94DRAFT_1799211 [Lactarius quietus]|nr:hypothetical protein EI94DRAFT_1799211 [Lactarius quietus]
MLSAIWTKLQQAIAQVQNNVTEGQVEFIKLCKYIISQLPPNIPPPCDLQPPAFQDGNAVVPFSSFTASNVSSSLSSLHLGSLNLDSPHTSTAGLSVSRQLGVVQEQSGTQTPGNMMQSTSKQGGSAAKLPTGALSVQGSCKSSWTFT